MGNLLGHHSMTDINSCIGWVPLSSSGHQSEWTEPLQLCSEQPMQVCKAELNERDVITQREIEVLVIRRRGPRQNKTKKQTTDVHH